MMISNDVEISIARGVDKKYHAKTTLTKPTVYRLFTPTTLTLETNTMCYTVVLLIIGHT